MSRYITISANRNKPKDDESAEDYTNPPAKIERDAFGYVSKGKTEPEAGCKSCFYYDSPNTECELFEMLNRNAPSIFELNEKVSPNAGCAAHTLIGKEK